MRLLREHLPTLGVAGIVAVCRGAHLLLIGVAFAGIGAGLVAQALGLAPFVLGAGIVGLVAVSLVRGLLRGRSRHSTDACCDVSSAMGPISAKEAPAR
ncbi:MAG: hypothetical protein HYU87_07750 [Chloroflexi bacterium]|nr:hypothetical protein [Chloroflexota bacterium]